MKKKLRQRGRPFWDNNPITRKPIPLHQKIDRVLEGLVPGAITPGKVTHVSVQHDAGCPALKTQNLADCICDFDVGVKKADA
jgi:hypothetical protein